MVIVADQVCGIWKLLQLRPLNITQQNMVSVRYVAINQELLYKDVQAFQQNTQYGVATAM